MALGIRRVSKAEQTWRKELEQAVISLLTGLGFTTDPDGGLLRYLGKTTVGQIRVAVNEDIIFCRFDEPAKARKVMDCNQFSGKWNHYYDFPTAIDACVGNFRRKLQRVLETPQEPVAAKGVQEEDGERWDGLS